jgi:predicted ATPase
MHPDLSLIRDVGGIAAPPRRRSRQTRVLIAWADPCSQRYPGLHGIESEVRGIVRALSTSECRRFEVEELQFATPSSLAKSVQAFRPDIFHFIGHSDCLPTGGIVVLESGQPNAEALLHGDDLAETLAKAEVQVAVLAGCVTAGAIASVGSELASKGIPAIVAMQAPLHDGAARLFARAFYGSLGSGETIDDAVLEGRSAMSGSGNSWAVPVVMRTPFDGPQFEDELEFDAEPDVRERRDNLTYDDRPFVGRQQERIELRDRISVKRQRLVTITGMGGMGKTRLGKQVSAELIDDFPDGVWMVECDTFDNREQLLGGIASVIGITDDGMDIERAVVQSLARKKLLLFLDCFERITEHADVLDAILKQTMDCHMIVTSRVVLGLSREFEYRLSPMGLKRKGGELSDSVALFAEAASHAVNAFEVTGKNRPLILELCKELEGVPLALVLAAGRLRHLSLSELLEQVRLHPLEVLRRRGAAKDRQADLYRVVASSFLLLGTRECGLLDHLGVFVGAFSVEDAAEVCGWSKVEMLNGLSVLRDHSLLQVQLQQDRTRFKLLDTVREFLVQLPRDDRESGDRAACAERHAVRYSRTAEEVGNLMSDGRSTDGTNLLWSEIGNLRAACLYCAGNGLHTLSRLLAEGLARTYFEMALHADFEQVVSMGLKAATALSDTILEAKLLGLAGADAATRKDEDAWRAYWTRRLAIYRSLGDLDGMTDTLFDMAWECVLLGQAEEADDYLNQAAELAMQAANHGLLGSCYIVRAQMEMKAGNREVAKRWVEDATREVTLTRNKGHLLYLNQHLTVLHENFGDRQGAARACMTMLGLSFEVHRYRNMAWALAKLAELHEAFHEEELATVCYLALGKLQGEYATRHGEQAKQMFVQYLKRHGEMSLLVQVHKKTPWQTLLRQLPYVGG